MEEYLIDFKQIKSVPYTDLCDFWKDIEFIYKSDFYENFIDSTRKESFDSTSFYLSSKSFNAQYSPAPYSPAPYSPQSQSSSQGSSPLMNDAFSPSPYSSSTELSKNSYYFDTKFRTPSSEEKPNVCKYCNRSFARRHDLERHMRVHTGIKPYICPACQKSFSRSDARGRHFISSPLCSQDSRVEHIIRCRRKRKTGL